MAAVLLPSIVLGLAMTQGFAQQPTGGLPAATRLAMPGPKHKSLDPLVGDWSVEMKVWPVAGAQPIVSNSLTAKREWALGGRYLREEFQGTFAGNLSHRIAMLSYNNLEDRFELSTIDTFEPGQMWYASHGPGADGRISMHGESVEAGFGPTPTGRKRSLRFDIEISKGLSVQRIFAKFPGEPEFLFVEQRYTPRK